MSMRVRDLQQYLGKFTENQKGTAISNCHIYIETHDGHLEEIRRIEIQVPFCPSVNFDKISCRSLTLNISDTSFLVS